MVKSDVVIKVEKESEARFLEAVKKHGTLAFHFVKFSKKANMPVSSAFEAWHGLIGKHSVEAVLMVDGIALFRHKISAQDHYRGKRK